MTPAPPPPAPRRAVITGAASGIGAALASRLARQGLELWLVDRDEAGLARTRAAIAEAGGRAHAVVLDLADADGAHGRLAAVDVEAGEAGEGIDLVVANAAVAGARGTTAISSCSWDDVRSVLEVNLLGAVASLFAFVPGMLERGHGQLVGISSLAARLPNPRTPVYGASKAGLTHFLEAADRDLRPRGVACTAVHPGPVRTPALDGVTTPLPSMVEADEAAAIIERAIGERAKVVDFPAHLSLAMRLLDSLPRAIGDPLIRSTIR